MHTVLCNADILVGEDLNRIANELHPSTVYWNNRAKVETHADDPKLFGIPSTPHLRFDLFLLPSEFVRLVRESRAFPSEFHIGEPWWDHLLPLIALAGGFPVKRLPLGQTLVLSCGGPQNYSFGDWSNLGHAFLGAVGRLAAEFPARACDLLVDIPMLSGPLDKKLTAASEMIYGRLP